MGIKSDYEEFAARREAFDKGPRVNQFFLHNDQRYVEPFRVYGNVYYVGDSWVCAYLIDTGDGLLLLDAGNAGATAMLVYSIWKLGFDPADIRWVVLSHGHIDHIGAAGFMREMFGSKIYLGAPDAEMFETAPERSFIQGGASLADTLPIPDYRIQDNEVIRFGKLEVRFRLIPGHSDGAIACFFDADENGVKQRVGFYGGFGLNTLTKDHLTQVGDAAFTMREKYLHSLEKVRNERVDLYLSNHGEYMGLPQKMQQLREHSEKNPFIDPGAWKKGLDEKRDQMLAMMQDPKNN